jgi:hypothetical protein
MVAINIAYEHVQVHNRRKALQLMLSPQIDKDRLLVLYEMQYSTHGVDFMAKSSMWCLLLLDFTLPCNGLKSGTTY